MKAKVTLLITIFCIIALSIKAQSFLLFGDRTYGTNVPERYANFVYAGNHQFILEGATTANVNGDKTDSTCPPLPGGGNSDIWMLKIDTGFNIIWDKDFGGSRSDQFAFSILTDNNQHIIFSAFSNSDSSCDKSENSRIYPTNFMLYQDYWIFMLDSSGNKIWDKTFGSSGPDESPLMIELTTGDFLVCGTGSNMDADKTVANYGLLDYWALKLDHAGHKIWDKVYGGTGQEFNVIGNNIGLSMLATENGGFILAGTTSSPASGLISDTSRGLADIWIIKCDSAGNKIWDKRYGGSSQEKCNHIIQTPDAGYIVCGVTNSQQGLDVSQPYRGDYDIWLIKLDGQGNKQWDKRYGGTGEESGVCVQVAPDGGYWISGSTRSDSSYEVSEHPYDSIPGLGDYYILKVDSTGNKIWDKRFGGPGWDEGSNFILMPDTSIYFFGFAYSGISAVKTDPGKGYSDYWLVHFKYGYTFTGMQEQSAIGNWQLAITPNPATTTCTIASTLQHSNTSTLTLFDITGRALQQQLFNNKMQLDVSMLARGVYIAEVRDTHGGSVKAEMVKQ